MILHYWNLTIKLFSVISRILVEESYPSAEMQPVYSAAPPADWARRWKGYDIKKGRKKKREWKTKEGDLNK